MYREDKMKINTERFGEIEVIEEDILTFSKGILGFESYKRFALINTEGGENSFYFLQSLEEEALCFLMLNTFSLFPDYQIELDETTIEQLEIQNPQDVIILTVITVVKSLQDATTNLQAPIIINVARKLGKQIVNDKGNYLIKQPLFSKGHITEAEGQRG